MPIYAGVGISTNKDYKLAAAEALSRAKINLKQKEASLAVVFSSFEFASPSLLEAISNIIGRDIPLFGAASNAVLTQNGIYKYGLAIALISTKEAHFNTAVVKDASTDLDASGNNLGKQLLFGMQGVRRRLCLFFSDGLIIDNHPLLKGLQQRFGLSFPIIGASVPSSNRLNKSYQYFNQEALDNSIIGLLWAGKLNFGLGIKHGWEPIGKPRRVNASDRFIIKQIENKPAVFLYQDYFAKDMAGLRKELKHISSLYPIGIDISGEEEYLLRNILSIQDDGSLVCRGSVAVDSQIRLMIGTKESCLAATREAAKEAKEALAIQTAPKQESASVIFVFNSVSRLYLLGREIINELTIIRSYFPGVPIIGLCTYGEQAPLKTTDFAGETYSHNQSITILAMN